MRFPQRKKNCKSLVKNALSLNRVENGQIQTLEQKASEIFVSNIMVKTNENLSFKEVSRGKVKKSKNGRVRELKEV